MKKILVVLLTLSLVFILHKIINRSYSITLPNGYTMEEVGASGKSNIYDNNGNVRIKEVLDFFVADDFIYGSEIKTHSYFVLNTKNNELHYPLDNRHYSALLAKYNLKDGYVSNAVNMFKTYQ